MGNSVTIAKYPCRSSKVLGGEFLRLKKFFTSIILYSKNCFSSQKRYLLLLPQPSFFLLQKFFLLKKMHLLLKNLFYVLSLQQLSLLLCKSSTWIPLSRAKFISSFSHGFPRKVKLGWRSAKKHKTPPDRHALHIRQAGSAQARRQADSQAGSAQAGSQAVLRQAVIRQADK